MQMCCLFLIAPKNNLKSGASSVQLFAKSSALSFFLISSFNCDPIVKCVCVCVSCHSVYHYPVTNHIQFAHVFYKKKQ